MTVLVLAFAAPLASADDGNSSDDPTWPVREGYRIEKKYLETHTPRQQIVRLPWQAPHRDKLFSRRMAALWALDERYSSATHAVGNVETDPFLHAQDSDDDVFRDLRVDVTARRGDHAEVRARFTNSGRLVDIRFDVVREEGRWAIDDIRAQGYSYAEALSRLHYCDPNWKAPCRR